MSANRGRATTSEVLGGVYRPVLPKNDHETRLNRFQDRITDFEELDMVARECCHRNDWRTLLDYIAKEKAGAMMRLDMERGQEASLPHINNALRTHLQQGEAMHDDQPDVFDHRAYSLREQSRG